MVPFEAGSGCRGDVRSRHAEKPRRGAGQVPRSGVSNDPRQRSFPSAPAAADRGDAARAQILDKRHRSNEAPIVTTSAALYRRRMPYRRADAEYLRQKARQFRKLAPELAAVYRAKMLELAAELEAKADEIEGRPDPRKAGP
jgi:hypothetical protein